MLEVTPATAFVGYELPVKTHLLTRTDLVKYAGASGDFNPMHHDEPMAQAAGQPSVFGHGMYSMGFLAIALTEWAGAASVTAFKVRFSSQTWPGETLRTRVVVRAVKESGGRRLTEVDCWLVNETGDVKVKGTATLSTFGETTSGRD